MEHPVIDLEHIERLGGLDDPAIREILDDFVRSLPTSVKTLASARQAGERTTYRAEAHRLKGAAAMTGFPQLSQQAAEAESAADDGSELPDPAALSAVVDQTVAAYREQLGG